MQKKNINEHTNDHVNNTLSFFSFFLFLSFSFFSFYFVSTHSWAKEHLTTLARGLFALDFSRSLLLFI